MVQLTIAHPTSLTSSSLQPDLIYAFNGSLFESKCIFLHNTHHSIYTLLTSSPSPRFHFFQSHTTITYVTTHDIRNLYFFHIWHTNVVTTFETNSYPRQYYLQIYSATSTRQEHISIWVRFLKTFFSDFFQNSMALRQIQYVGKYYSIPSYNIQKRILQNLLKISSNHIFSDSHNPDRVIFSFSLYELTDNEKNVLCKGLNFSIKPGLIEYSEFLLHFQLFFRDIKREDLCNEDTSLIKARLLDTALLHTKTSLVTEILLRIQHLLNLKPVNVCQKIKIL